jgi:hypothetical protein
LLIMITHQSWPYHSVNPIPIAFDPKLKARLVATRLAITQPGLEPTSRFATEAVRSSTLVRQE